MYEEQEKSEEGCSSCCLWGSIIGGVVGVILLILIIWALFFRSTDLFSKSKKEVLAAVDAVNKEKLDETAKKTLKGHLTKFFELLAAHEEKKRIVDSVESVSIQTLTTFSTAAFDGKVDDAFSKLAKYIKDDARTKEQFGAQSGFTGITATFKFSKEVNGKKSLDNIGGPFDQMQTKIDAAKKDDKKDDKKKE